MAWYRDSINQHYVMDQWKRWFSICYYLYFGLVASPHSNLRIQVRCTVHLLHIRYISSTCCVFIMSLTFFLFLSFYFFPSECFTACYDKESFRWIGLGLLFFFLLLLKWLFQDVLLGKKINIENKKRYKASYVRFLWDIWYWCSLVMNL